MSLFVVVVGVHPAGAFVRPVGFAVDGLVPRESIEDAWEDEVDFDEKRMQLQGYRTRQGITLGDELSVDLIGVDIMLRRIQFAMTDAVEKIHREIGGGGRGRKPDELLRRARDRFVMVSEILLTVEEGVGNHRANVQAVVRGTATVVVLPPARPQRRP